MKLLVITQEVDEQGSILGFFIDWMRGLSKYFKKIKIVHFRGKGAKISENSETILVEGNKLKKILILNRIILDEKPDKILVHMCPEFMLAIIPSLLFTGIPAYLFYAHGSISLKLKFATLFAKKVLTTTESGFRLETEKKIVLHQGIDINRYKSGKNDYFLDVARISTVKNHDIILKAFAKIDPKLRKKLLIVGSGDQKLLEKLKKLTKELNIEGEVTFLGAISHEEIPDIYSDCCLFISASKTGSLDKTGLEAMASAKPILVCNEAFNDILSGFEDYCFFESYNVDDLYKKMLTFIENDELRHTVGDELRSRVRKQHNLNGLVEKMAKEIKEANI